MITKQINKCTSQICPGRHDLRPVHRGPRRGFEPKASARYLRGRHGRERSRLSLHTGYNGRSSGAVIQGPGKAEGAIYRAEIALERSDLMELIKKCFQVTKSRRNR